MGQEKEESPSEQIARIWGLEGTENAERTRLAVERSWRLEQLGARVLEILTKRYHFEPQPGWPEGSRGPTGAAQLLFSHPGTELVDAARSLGLLAEEEKSS